MLFGKELETKAGRFLDECRVRRLHLATAESCTGGLLSGLLTQVSGSSDVVMESYVTYAYAAKTALLGVPGNLLQEQGAVSEDVAVAMAHGALTHDYVDLSIAITGVAGPGSDSEDKPAGLVWLAAALKTAEGNALITRKCEFGDIGREAVRLATLDAALDLVSELLTDV